MKTFLVEEMERETPFVHITAAAAAGKTNKCVKINVRTRVKG
jgi:hypothetical protein